MAATDKARPRARTANGEAAGVSVAELTATAHALADVSGAAILPHFRRVLTVDNKLATGGFDPVTKADRAAEKAIAKTLGQRHPTHGMIGEEFGAKGKDSRYTWIIDPIDGTRAFILGLPLWGSLIGLLDRGRPIVGLMDQPYTRERFWSGAKHSSMRDVGGRERRLKSRTCARLADAMLMATSPDMFPAGDPAERFQRIRGDVRMTRFGGDCYAYCLLAAGHVDLVVEYGLKPYDIVALIPIIEQAGGRVTTWTGEPATAGGAIVAAGDPRLHELAVKRLGG